MLVGMMAKAFVATPLACATGQGYDPFFALCVACIKRAKLDNDLDFFESAMYEIMFAYCQLAVPGYFSRYAEMVLPKGVVIDGRDIAR
jgi:hypothetical protein